MTLLFTDIVGSSDVATALGDRRWKTLQGRHHEAVREELKRHNGEEVDTAGDGFFATFRTPDQGVRAAAAIVAAVRELGLDIRAGVHIGEVELTGEKVSGIAVTIAARIGALAGPGQVLVSATITDLTAGSGLTFSDLGTKDLKGVTGRWDLSSLVAVDGTGLPPPLRTDEAREIRDRAAPPEAPHGGKPRWLLPTATVSALALILISVAIIERRGQPPLSPSSQPTIKESVALVDERTGEILRSDVPNAGPIALPRGSEGYGWIFSAPACCGAGEATLVKVHSSDGAVVGDPIDLGPLVRSCLCIADSPRMIWAPISSTAPLSDNGRISVAVVDVVTEHHRTISLDVRISAGAVRSLVWGAGYLWAGDTVDDLVYRIDPSNGATRKYELNQGVDRMTFGEGFLWVLDHNAGTLRRMNPRTGHVSRPLQLQGDLVSLSAGGGYVWVADRSEPRLYEVETNDINHEPLPLPDAPIAVSYADGGLWVATEGNPSSIGGSVGEVQHIGGATIAGPYLLGINPSWMTVGEGKIWVSGYPTGSNGF